MRPGDRAVEVDGARVCYHRTGTGPTLVLIHGASGNLGDWLFQHVDMLTRDWDVIAFDRPGLGYSERLRDMTDPRAQAAHLDAALARLGVDRAVIAGHSYGGSVALAWAVTRPERVAGLALFAAPSHEWQGSAGTLYTIADAPVIGPAVAWAYPRLAGPRLVRDGLRAVFAPDPMPEGYAEVMRPELALRYATVRANVADINRLKPHLVEMTPAYPDLAMPMEILHGTADTIVPIEIHSEHLAAAVPHARFTRLDGTGHMPHHSRMDAAMAAFARLREQA
ncbi:alpha/beta fold hydrolase [Roseobacter sp. HKCCA0434]|uniref:alpha/beta fold hydrolase n=1 Tax=Roseobacter sp. HKCCA0434 TaxID=3079297 RepID=UPI0029059322|nr:alpha/beta fold hydrolase [Roseobacter sp. HKCCA0434]